MPFSYQTTGRNWQHLNEQARDTMSLRQRPDGVYVLSRTVSSFPVEGLDDVEEALLSVYIVYAWNGESWYDFRYTVTIDGAPIRLVTNEEYGNALRLIEENEPEDVQAAVIDQYCSTHAAPDYSSYPTHRFQAAALEMKDRFMHLLALEVVGLTIAVAGFTNGPY